MGDKKQDLKYIKGFSKISIKSICEEVGVDRGNLLNGKASAKSTELVKNKIIQKIKEIGENEN